MDGENRDLLEEKLRLIYGICNQPLKSGWIKSRKVGGGRQEDFIEGSYVIRMLNNVFPCGWSRKIKAIEILDESKNDRGNVVITAECQMVLKIHPWGEVLVEHEDVGSVEMFAPTRGAAMSNARKGAVTDALKRCAKSLGNRFGLALSMDPEACKAIGAVEFSGPNDPTIFETGHRPTAETLVEEAPSVEEIEPEVAVKASKGSSKYPWLDSEIYNDMLAIFKKDKSQVIGGRLKSKIINNCTSALIKNRAMHEEDAEEMVCSIFESVCSDYRPPCSEIPNFFAQIDEYLSAKV